MKVDILSDTHGFHRDPFFDDLLESDADMLIHAGDLTMSGGHGVYHDINEWFGDLPHNDIIVIGGNHDYTLEQIPTYGFKCFTNATYLEDSSVKIDDKIFYGSPKTSWDNGFIGRVFAFGSSREKIRWSIPKDVDILITHSPPYGYNDTLAEKSSDPGRNIGDEKLLEKIEKIKPKYNIHGHIHEGYGIDSNKHTTFINGSSVNESYNLVNKPITINI